VCGLLYCFAYSTYYKQLSKIYNTTADNNLEENIIKYHPNSNFRYLDQDSKKSLDREIKNFKKIGINNVEKRSRKIIASLTSYPSKIQEVKYAIFSLLNQSLKPDKVILWLSKDEFKNAILPKELIDLTKSGLEIKYVDDNIMSHKKYYYAIKEYPNDLIALFDDDFYYQSSLINTLYTHYLYNPKEIIAYAANNVALNNNKIFFKDHETKGEPPYRTGSGFNNNFLSGSGCIIQSSLFDSEVLNSKKFMKLSPYCDQSWLWVMALKKKTRIFVINGPTDGVFINLYRKISENNHTLRSVNDNNDKKQIEHLENLLNEYELMEILNN
jgi:hypothetical protein